MSDYVDTPPDVPAPLPNSRADAIDVVFVAWVVEFINDGPVSRSTEAYNLLTATALPILRARLLSEA